MHAINSQAASQADDAAIPGDSGLSATAAITDDGARALVLSLASPTTVANAHRMSKREPRKNVAPSSAAPAAHASESASRAEVFGSPAPTMPERRSKSVATDKSRANASSAMRVSVPSDAAPPSNLRTRRQRAPTVLFSCLPEEGRAAKLKAAEELARKAGCEPVSGAYYDENKTGYPSVADVDVVVVAGPIKTKPHVLLAICSGGRAPALVSYAWLVASAEGHAPKPFADYVPQLPADLVWNGEKTLGPALSRAATEPVFVGASFMLSPALPPVTIASLTAVISAAGGAIIEELPALQAATGAVASSAPSGRRNRAASKTASVHDIPPLFMVCGDAGTPKNRKWESMLASASTSQIGARSVNKGFVALSVLRQHIMTVVKDES